MSNIAPEDSTPDAERLHYSGSTHATTDDGTSATDIDLPGDGPTGKETVDVSDVVEDGDTPLINRLQPGTE